MITTDTYVVYFLLHQHPCYPLDNAAPGSARVGEWKKFGMSETLHVLRESLVWMVPKYC